MGDSGDDLQYSAEQHVMELTSPLDKTLLIHTLKVREKISEPFLIQADVYCVSAELDFSAILGEQVSIHVELSSGSKRDFHGVVSKFYQGETTGSIATHSVTNYRLEIVPLFQFFAETKNCRIFLKKSVKQILEIILGERKLPDGTPDPKPKPRIEFRTDLKRDTRSSLAIEYCVQYQESDFDFCSRIMEEVGLGYYFDHQSDRHTLVVFDHWAPHKTCPSDGRVRYWPAEGGATSGLDTRRITSFEMMRSFHAGKFTTSDFDPQFPGNPEDPGAKLLQSTALAADVTGCDDRFEIFEFPGEYKRVLDGKELTDQFSYVAQQEACRIVATSTCPGFTPGYTFEMSEHPRESLNNEYLITAVEHVITQPVSVAGAEDQSVSYQGNIACLPYRDDHIPFVPAQKTPKPRIHGIQSATVVSKIRDTAIDIGEPDTPEYGQVLLKFSWDRSPETTSCRVRLSQNEAGKQWGTMSIPHHGHEVLVSYLNGDPDHPVVVGRVYNAVNVPAQGALERPSSTEFRVHKGVIMQLEGGYGPKHGQT